MQVVRTDDTEGKKQGEKSGGVTGRKRIVTAHCNTVNKRELYIWVMGGKIRERARGISKAFDNLRYQTGKQCTA